MAKNCGISKLHLLVAPLTFTRVVKAAVSLPIVVVAMLLTGLGVKEDEYVWTLCRRTYAPLLLPSKPLMESFTEDALARPQIPHESDPMLKGI